MAQKNRYIKWGLTVFCVVAAILLFYDTLFGHQVLQKFIRQFSGAVRPVLYGAFMAYLLVPVVDFFERQFCSIQAVKKAVQTGKTAMAVPGAEHPADLGGHRRAAVSAGVGFTAGTL